MEKTLKIKMKKQKRKSIVKSNDQVKKDYREKLNTSYGLKI